MVKMETSQTVNTALYYKLPCLPEILISHSVLKLSFMSRYEHKLTLKLLIFNIDKQKMGGNTLVQKNLTLQCCRALRNNSPVFHIHIFLLST